MDFRQEQGQALVEMALVISILLVLILGIVEFARIGHVYLVTAHASREGARVGSLQYSDGDIVEAVRKASASLDLEHVVVTINPSEGLRHRGEGVEVVVSYELAMITPVGSFLPNPFPIENKSIMRVE